MECTNTFIRIKWQRKCEIEKRRRRRSSGSSSSIRWRRKKQSINAKRENLLTLNAPAVHWIRHYSFKLCSAKTIFLCHCVCAVRISMELCACRWRMECMRLHCELYFLSASPNRWLETIYATFYSIVAYHNLLSQNDRMHAHTTVAFPLALLPSLVCDTSELWNVDKYGWMVSELMDKDMRFEGFYHLLSACSIAFELDSPPIDSDYFQQQQKLLANELRFFPIQRIKNPYRHAYTLIHTCVQTLSTHVRNSNVCNEFAQRSPKRRPVWVWVEKKEQRIIWSSKKSRKQTKFHSFLWIDWHFYCSKIWLGLRHHETAQQP